ncbi:hypothetical protein CWS72_14565 [Telmatospirillum siberiense]|uniref:Uncharacterized protein n=2 Tax=Telmatospirillum siberiense TaxID=382514 RepID=A0A2N3PU06_9PROT|nr:hypothetical protein CWS72_14565 [Telmatospirillum siberiense]
MVYPPANQAGAYHDVVPSIVFKNFALPWMRSIDPNGGENPDGPPWMALLTLHEAEMAPTPGMSAPSGADPKLTFPATITAGKLTHPENTSVLPPALPGIAADDPQQVLACDMNLAFFRQIAPTLADLPYLAHARGVNTDGKTLLGMDLDGCFSLVTGNRMPGEGGTNTVLLVSLEGHQNHLPGGGDVSGYTKIRLAVLGRWQFLANQMPGSFLSLMEQLCSLGRGGVRLLKAIDTVDPAAPPADREAPVDPMVKEALAIGYVALQNDLRDGEVTTSLYRGPLVPQPTEEDRDYGPYLVSDHAVLYDPDYGFFNHAYAAGWQVGRLLALSSGTFTRDVQQWRRQFASGLQATQARQTVTGSITRALAASAADSWGKLDAAPPLEAAMRAYFGQRLNPSILPVMTPRGMEPARGGLPGAKPDNADDGSVDPLTALHRRIKGAP